MKKFKECQLIIHDNYILLYSVIYQKDILKIMADPTASKTSESQMIKDDLLIEMVEEISRRIAFGVTHVNKTSSLKMIVTAQRLFALLGNSNIHYNPDMSMFEIVKPVTEISNSTEVEFTEEEQLILLLIDDGYIVQKKDGNIIVKGKE